MKSDSEKEAWSGFEARWWSSSREGNWVPPGLARPKMEMGEAAKRLWSLDDKEETKQRGCSPSVLEVVAKGKEVRRGLGGVATSSSDGDRVFGGFARREGKMRVRAVGRWATAVPVRGLVAVAFFILDVRRCVDRGCSGSSPVFFLATGDQKEQWLKEVRWCWWIAASSSPVNCANSGEGEK